MRDRGESKFGCLGSKIWGTQGNWLARGDRVLYTRPTAGVVLTYSSYFFCVLNTVVSENEMSLPPWEVWEVWRRFSNEWL